MKTHYSAFAFVTLMISATALATDRDTDAKVTVQGNSKHTPAYASPDEARELIGKYTLDNGKTLIMTQKYSHYFVEIAGKAPIQLIPSNSTSFTSNDKSIQLKFTPSADGKTTRVLAHYVES